MWHDLLIRSTGQVVQDRPVVFALWADVPGHPLRWPSPGITSADVPTAADAQRFRARYLTSRVLAEVPRRVEHRRMLPDQGCYEERYRLTGAVAWELAGPRQTFGGKNGETQTYLLADGLSARVLVRHAGRVLLRRPPPHQGRRMGHWLGRRRLNDRYQGSPVPVRAGQLRPLRPSAGQRQRGARAP